MPRHLTRTDDEALLQLLNAGKWECPVMLETADDSALYRIMEGLRKDGRVVRYDHEDGVRFTLSHKGKWQAELIAKERANA